MLIWLAQECAYLVAIGHEHAVSDDEDADVCPSTIETVLGVFGTRPDAERCVGRRIACLRVPVARRPVWPPVWEFDAWGASGGGCLWSLWSARGAPQYCWTVEPWVLGRGPALLAEVAQTEWWRATPLESAERS
jgi:hypothetical protein